MLQCEAITDVDVTAAEMLEQLDDELNAPGIHMAFAEMRARLQDLVFRYGLFETLDRDHFYPTLDAAIAAIGPRARIGGVATVTDAPDRSRFEIELDGALVGFAQYRRRPGVIAFIHTEIDRGHDGEGLGGTLVRAALDAARAEGAEVLPFCPFVQGYIDRPPRVRGPRARRAAGGVRTGRWLTRGATGARR